MWQIDYKDLLLLLILLLLVLFVFSFYLLRINLQNKRKIKALNIELETFKEILYHLPVELFVFQGKELYFQNKKALEVFGTTFTPDTLKKITIYRGKKWLPVIYPLRKDLEILLFQDVTEKEGFKEAYQMALSYLSHELKTPLAVAYLHFEALEKKLADTELDKEITEGFEKAKEALEKLRNLIKRLFSGLDYLAKEVPIKKERISLKQILEEAIFWVSPIAEDKKVSIHMSSLEENYYLKGSEELFIQAFFNVLENAIKFSPAGAKVDIKVYPTSEKSIVISVRDYGSGVEPDKLHLLGLPFVKIGKGKGMGLGLFITRRIVESHGGTVKFNLPPAGGLEVEIILPL